MRAVTDFAHGGGHVLGVCNGFQVLIEAGLLPGALMRNAGLRFICAPAGLTVATTDSAFTAGYAEGARIEFGDAGDQRGKDERHREHEQEAQEHLAERHGDPLDHPADVGGGEHVGADEAAGAVPLAAAP